MHDRIAELRGLRDELALCENGPRRETRAGAAGLVREQITRVRGELAEDADRLDAEAEDYTDKGQDGIAGERAVAARAIRAALDADEPGKTAKPSGRASSGGKRNTAAQKAPEQT